MEEDLREIRAEPTRASMRAPGRNRSRLIIGLALPTVLVVGPVNFVLYRVCYATYGEEYNIASI